MKANTLAKRIELVFMCVCVYFRLFYVHSYADINLVEHAYSYSLSQIKTYGIHVVVEADFIEVFIY